MSIGDILLNDARDDGFLIDLDLAIRFSREKASGAPNKTGIEVFTAIWGADKGRQCDWGAWMWMLTNPLLLRLSNFMHDAELIGLHQGGC